jgi:hypothetical protein
MELIIFLNIIIIICVILRIYSIIIEYNKGGMARANVLDSIIVIVIIILCPFYLIYYYTIEPFIVFFCEKNDNLKKTNKIIMNKKNNKSSNSIKENIKKTRKYNKSKSKSKF